MVAKREKGRKPGIPLLERNQTGFWHVFIPSRGDAFSYFETLVRPPERHYSESAGFLLPAAKR
jgi:hypothetical protein